MPIKFPDFANSRCVALTACADVKSGNKELVRWLKAEKQAPNLIRVGEKPYIFLSLGGGGKHFHIDVSTKESLRKAFAPAQKATTAQLDIKLAPLIGSNVILKLKGMFEIDIADLPESGIVKSLFFQTQLGDVALKLKGARFAIKGAPVNEIIWQTLKDESKIGVIMEIEDIQTKVAEDYLTGPLSMFETALKVFVLG